jgi:hypothetical protein
MGFLFGSGPQNQFQAQTPGYNLNQVSNPYAGTPGGPVTLNWGGNQIPTGVTVPGTPGTGGNQAQFLPALSYQVSGVGGQNYAGQANTGFQNTQGAVGNLQQVYGQQQAQNQQLQQEAAGGGPGAAIAQAKLREATEQNIAQGQAAAAGAKGTDVAEASRNAVDVAANANQTAAGQAAVLGSQYQLGAEQALAQGLGQQAQTAGAIGQLGMGQYGAAGGQGLQALGTMGGLNQAQAALATQAALGTQGQNIQLALGQGEQNLQAQGINAGVAAQNANTSSGLIGGLLSGVGSFLGMGGGGGGGASAAAAAKGGEVVEGGVRGPGVGEPHLWVGGDLVPDFTRGVGAGGSYASGLSSLGKDLGAMAKGKPANQPDTANYQQDALAAMGQPMPEEGFARGGRVPRMDMRGGGHVPGKPRVSGDSIKNDVVPAMLSPGEVVIPRTKARDPEKARNFVAHLAARRSRRGR